MPTPPYTRYAPLGGVGGCEQRSHRYAAPHSVGTHSFHSFRREGCGEERSGVCGAHGALAPCPLRYLSTPTIPYDEETEVGLHTAPTPAHSAAHRVEAWGAE